MIKLVKLAQMKIQDFAQNRVIGRTAQEATPKMAQLRLDTPSGVSAKAEEIINLS